MCEVGVGYSVYYTRRYDANSNGNVTCNILSQLLQLYILVMHKAWLEFLSLQVLGGHIYEVFESPSLSTILTK